MKRIELAARLIPSLTDMALVEMYAQAVRETARERIGTQAHDEAHAVEHMFREALEGRVLGCARGGRNER